MQKIRWVISYRMALGFGSINMKDKVFGVPLVGIVFPTAQ